jgi:hypothetical protein
VSKYLKKKNHLIGIQITVIYILVLAITVMITAISQRVKYENQIAEINANHEEEMSALRIELQEDYESQVAEIERYYEYGGDITQIELEAEYIAKVIYGTARDHSDSDKRAVVWCILNRVEHYGHPDTVQGVCEQPKQWMGYSSENPVLTDIYDLALAELKTWHSGGHRPLSNDYIYLTWSSKEILLRDTFEENKSTNYWRMR